MAKEEINSFVGSARQRNSGSVLFFLFLDGRAISYRVQTAEAGIQQIRSATVANDRAPTLSQREVQRRR